MQKEIDKITWLTHNIGVKKYVDNAEDTNSTVYMTHTSMTAEKVPKK